MTPSLGSERNTVQDPIIHYAQEIGWTHMPPEDILNLCRGESGWLLYPLLRDRLIALNPGVVDSRNVEEIISRIESVRCSIEGNAEILKWLRGEHSAHAEDEKRKRNVTLIDF